MASFHKSKPLMQVRTLTDFSKTPRALTARWPGPAQDPVIEAIAAETGKSPAQVLLRWAIQRGTIVLPKSVTPARIISNADIFSFSLSEAQVSAAPATDDAVTLLQQDAGSFESRSLSGGLCIRAPTPTFCMQVAAINSLDKPGLEGCFNHPRTPWLGRSEFVPGKSDHYYSA